jgi:hypothetical protein
MVAALLFGGEEDPHQADAHVAARILRFDITLDLEEDELTTNLGHGGSLCEVEKWGR